MTHPCDGTLTLHEVVQTGPLVLELWVAKQMCVQPTPETAHLSEAPLVVRVRNQGTSPVQLVAADPDALHVTQLWDAERPTAPMDFDRGPEPQEVPMVTADIAPGATWQSSPVLHYLNPLTPHFLGGTFFADGTPMEPGFMDHRTVGIEVHFSANINAGAGFAASNTRLKGAIDVVLLPPTQE